MATSGGFRRTFSTIKNRISSDWYEQIIATVLWIRRILKNITNKLKDKEIQFFMTIVIVVARYNEHIEWTELFPNVVVYNKGKQLPKGYNEICLDNVGREGHTYYKHICDNYDRLEDYTIFLQGQPFDHSPNIIKNIYKYIDESKIQLDFEFLSENKPTTNLKGCKYHADLPLMDVYRKLFGRDGRIGNFKFGSGAQFIVSKRQILKRPKEFYLKIVEMLEYSIDPIEGYVIERLHPLIFG